MPTLTDLLELPAPVPEPLRPWLAGLTAVPPLRAATEPFVRVPHGSTLVVFRAGQPAAALGPASTALYPEPDKPRSCLRLRLAPGAAGPLLGIGAAELTDRMVPLAALPGPLAQLAPELDQLPPEELLPRLATALPARVTESATQRAHRALLATAVRAITAHPGGPTVTALARSLAVSERQLRSLFTTGIGLSPKHYARIARLRLVLERAGRAPWAHLAADTGYYDHSHLTAEFRALMGVSPSAFAHGALPAATGCTPFARR
ncbi:AraC family transcriptional regulator [Nocardia sp. NPDC050697]|uniref:AraC family transcriptional regulator n=1 Tax=Nocardia sp. NPDC050697 TaxID=3155158 RepID=UPI00340070AE